MSNDVTRNDDDGFSGPIGRGFGGNYLKWSATGHWVDRDGVVPPSPMLVLSIDEILKMWKDQVPTIIRDKPLPDPDVLNAAIPIEQWELGLDGKPSKPWKHNIEVVFVNPITGQLYIYQHDTVGAHIAYDQLKESVIVMRSLRGTKCMPLVNFAERPMKSKRFDKVPRPHFEIVGWKNPPGEGSGEKAIADKPKPQLPGPNAAEKPAPAPTFTAPTTGPMPAQAAPQAPATPAAQESKPTIALTGDTLSAMSDVAPITTKELLDDSINF
jgi:hypothetical protein